MEDVPLEDVLLEDIPLEDVLLEDIPLEDVLLLLLSAWTSHNWIRKFGM